MHTRQPNDDNQITTPTVAAGQNVAAAKVDTTMVAGQDAATIIEAAIFAAANPVPRQQLQQLIATAAAAGLTGNRPETLDRLLSKLVANYRDRGIRLVENEHGFFFMTAPEVGSIIRKLVTVTKPLSRAGLEVLAAIAWHQPVTRAEIEQIRGVSLSGGILDHLMRQELVRPLGRRAIAGLPLEWGTTAKFLQHFNLASLDQLPGIEELRQAGFLARQATEVDPDINSATATNQQPSKTEQPQLNLEPLAQQIAQILGDQSKQQNPK